MMRFIPFAIFLLITGCAFPYHFTARFGAAGTVVNAKTLKPVSNASVTISDSKKSGAAITDNNGKFSIPAERFWSIYIVPADPYWLRNTLKIQHSGYSLYQTNFTGSSMCTGTQTMHDVGIVHLQPITK